MNAEKTFQEQSERELEIVLKKTLEKIEAPDPDNILQMVQSKIQAKTPQNSGKN